MKIIFTPEPDITAYELSYILTQVWEFLAKPIIITEMQYQEMKPEHKRHFTIYGETT